ncbi:hypothetical protein ACVNPS_07300 [Candidatus Bipolaricaulota sp. J31]
MIRGVGFIFVELLRASVRNWSRWLGFAILLGLALASGSALALIQEGGSGTDSPREHWILVIGLSPDLRDEGVNELCWEFWTLEGVTRVSYRFAGDELPGGGAAGERCILLWIEDGARVGELEERVRALAGASITGIDTVHLRASAPVSLPPLSRVIAMVALALFAIASLLVGKVAVGHTLSAWRNEWDFLRYSGVEPWKLWVPFVGTAAVWGLLGGAVYLLVYEGGKLAVGKVAAVGQIAPGYLAASPFPFLVAFLVAPLWAAAAGGIALLLSLHHRRLHPEDLVEA